MARMTPDRFARTTRTAFDRWVRGIPSLEAESVAARLLRQEHRAVVRQIHRLRLQARKTAFAAVLAKKRPDWHDAKIEVLDDLLAILAKRVQ